MCVCVCVCARAHVRARFLYSFFKQLHIVHCIYLIIFTGKNLGWDMELHLTLPHQLASGNVFELSSLPTDHKIQMVTLTSPNPYQA